MTHSKVALITGAGTGIGQAAAKALARSGFAIVLAGRRHDKLVASAAQIETETLVVPTDVCDPQSVKHVFDQTRERFGRLDLLFNNAGIGGFATPVEDIPYERLRAVSDTNLTGAFLCSQEAFRIMKAQTPQGGRIINNGSISAHAPRPFSSPYTATKHAISGLTKALALDGRAHNICCGQIDIGNAATELTERMSEGILQANGELMPEPRMDVEHVGAAVAYMANLPSESNVLFMTVMATKMPFVGRG
jgi:NAD(P)-dependent dehydrogenase (short-subunit alcohol dehydrogenase family)